MKWKSWDVNHWVLEASDGEVIEEIKQEDLSRLFVVKSTGKKYTSIKAAKEAGVKGKKENDR